MKSENDHLEKNLSLKDFTDFVAVKNGMHDEKGYLYYKDFAIPKEMRFRKK